MPQFSYKGRNVRGEIVQGVMDAQMAASIAEQLSSTGITPLDIKEVVQKEDNEPIYLQSRKAKREQNQRVNTQDIMLFSRQMNILQKAGVPILFALQGLQDSTIKKAFIAVLKDIKDSLDAGRDLASTLMRHPKHFSNFYISMVRVGEMSGKLDEIFLKLYLHMEFELETRNRVKAALRYPMFVMIAIFLALIVVNVFVIPVFAKVFESFNAKLPFLTQMLIASSNFFVDFWWLVLAVLVGSVWSFSRFIKGSGKKWWDRRKLTLPIAGPIVLKTSLARFANSFSMCLKSGIPISQSLSVVAQTLDNDFLAARIDDARLNVERGEAFTSSAKKMGVFPPVVIQMISVGEDSGSLEEMLDNIAEMYNRETEYEIKGLAAAIEPILLVFVAAMVLVLALGIFLPLWNLGAAAMGRS